jgi:1-deoxy-D-xylulose-5-phosphate synthase
LATQGMVPFCNIYSSFMQRAYDQVIHDVAIQNLNVIFCLDRAGFAGADGATHHGAYDLAYMRCIPNMTVSAPMNEEELRNLMFTAQQENMGPFVIRYPRGNGVMVDWQRPMKAIPVGKGRKVCDGEDVAILSIGAIGNEVIKAFSELNADGYHPAHYDMRFVKPLDEALLHEVFTKFDKIITVEDGCLQGGMGSAVIEFMADNDYHAKVIRLGIPDKVIEHGEQPELWAECGFNAAGIAIQVRKIAVKRRTETIAS